MLSCDDVQRDLPGLVTGEKASHEVREHIAKCDACRAERDRLAREIEGVRADLAALAPSPFLEDAVLEAAHVEAEKASTRRPWHYVAAAFVAVAALFLVVLLPRLQERGGNEVATPIPGEEGDEEAPRVVDAARIEVPPSRGEVQEARQKNARSMNLRAATAGPDEMDYDTWPDGAPTDRETTKRFLPPALGVDQRYVSGDTSGRPGTRTYVMTWMPSAEGVFYLGTGLLDEIGGALRAGRVGEILVGDRRWETTPGTMQGEIDVTSPEAGGAEARVRVLVSTGYSGTLLLEEPLAYALGLHQFEIPGPVRFTDSDGNNIPVRGWRARARVRIPEIEFDRVVEVQVVRARPWMVKRGRRARETGLLFRGLKPRTVIRATDLVCEPSGAYELENAEVTQGGALEHVEVGPGSYRFVIGFQRGEKGVPMLPDVPILGRLFDSPFEHAALIPQALDFTSSTLHVLDIETVALNGRWEPGAPVTIARVWRGKTAIPSAEAVIRTVVGEDGRIAFPRIAGEKGSTLKMLVTKKDGTATFHDVVVAPELRTRPRLEMVLGADGEVRARGWAVTLFEGPWKGDDATEMPEPRRFANLVDFLHRRVAGEGVRDDGGEWMMELVLRVEPDAPWRMVQWVLAAAADPRVQVPRFLLGRTDAMEDALLSYPLPIDFDIELATPPWIAQRALTVTLLRSARGEAIGIRLWESGRDALLLTEAEFADRVRNFLVAVQGEDALFFEVQVKVPPPGLVTFAEGFRVLEGLAAAGVIDEVTFEGAPPR